MSNLSETTEAVMAAAVADDVTDEAVDTTTETDEVTTEEAGEDSSNKDDIFRLDANDVPFKNLLAAKDAGDATYKVMLSAFAAVWGKDVEVIQTGFNNTIKSEKAKAEIVKFDKELAGYTPGHSLIRLLQDGNDIAADGGGNVSFNIVLVKGEKAEDGTVAPDTAVIQSVWRGIDGMASRRSGGSGTRGRFQYFDDGKPIDGVLKKYLLEKRSTSFAAARIRKNEADKAAGKKGNLSAFVAAQDGKKDGDTFAITRGEKKTDSSSS